jgi:chemotaxis protein methyltransferase CheR
MSTLASQATQLGGTYVFSDADFGVIAKRAHQEFGLHLTEAKKDLVYSRLTKRLRQLGITDFRDYVRLLEEDEAERVHMLSALTTNVTQFFREDHHFKTLRDTVLPGLIAKARQGGRVRIWSAGCSAGQEPYSLAFTLLEVFPEAAKHDIRILATDVDPAILARATAGIYDGDEAKSLPAAIKDRFATISEKGSLTVGPQARALISFGELNLMAAWPFRGLFDVIFCRNVAIYFDKDTQAQLWQRFGSQLAQDGYLFIGHSERLNGPASGQFQSCGVTSYRKLTAQNPSDASLNRNGTTP